MLIFQQKRTRETACFLKKSPVRKKRFDPAAAQGQHRPAMKKFFGLFFAAVVLAFGFAAYAEVLGPGGPNNFFYTEELNENDEVISRTYLTPVVLYNSVEYWFNTSGLRIDKAGNLIGDGTDTGIPGTETSDIVAALSSSYNNSNNTGVILVINDEP
jgi:hypothetical protein